MTLHFHFCRFFKDSNRGSLPTIASTFKARVSRVINAFSSVRIVLSSSSHVALVRRFVRSTRRSPCVFRVGANHQLIRRMGHLTHVFLNRFNHRFSALTLATKRDHKELPRLSVARTCVLRGLRFQRSQKGVLRGLRHRVSHRVRGVHGKFPTGTSFRHFPIMSLTVAFFAKGRRVQRRVRLSHLMAIPFTHLTASTKSVRQRASKFMTARFQFERVRGRVTSVQGSTNVDDQVASQQASSQ